MSVPQASAAESASGALRFSVAALAAGRPRQRVGLPVPPDASRATLHDHYRPSNASRIGAIQSSRFGS
jgi:hypothetical protein